MPSKARDSNDPGLADGKEMLGILALLAADRDDRVDGGSPKRSELVLADAGFFPISCGELTGKNAEAVRSTVRRNQTRKASRRE